MHASASFVALLAGMSGTGRSHIALTVGSLRLPPCHGAFHKAELMSVPARHSGIPKRYTPDRYRDRYTRALAEGFAQGDPMHVTRIGSTYRREWIRF